MSNREKILEQFPLATVKNQYYGLYIIVPIECKQDLIDLLADYGIGITGACGDSNGSFYVTIQKY